MTALHLVPHVRDQRPVELQVAECALALAGIWLEEKSRRIRPSVELLLSQAREESAKADNKNLLLFECVLLAGCTMRAISTIGIASDRWTVAVRVVADSVRINACGR